MWLAGVVGGGMFVGCVVAGSVVLANGGAKARGALLRDVSTYFLAVSAVLAMLVTGQVRQTAIISSN